MSVDKNLFLYNLSVVAIMKNEAPYAKEWLDYHLLAGVEHFYIYDNDSPDNLIDVLTPYIEKNLVTYTFYPGKCRQYEAYNEATRNFRFFSRYMTFIDGDEFIRPKTNQSVVEIVDEIFADKNNIGGLAVNLYNYGSNFQETADYSRGVMERFTRRSADDDAPIIPENGQHGGNAHVSTITNPRAVKYFDNPHFARYFLNFKAINEQGEIVPSFSNYPVTVDKIVMHHYTKKSREEYEQKINRGPADGIYNVYREEKHAFSHEVFNDVFDDGILKYRDARQEMNLPLKVVDKQKLIDALLKNLSPTFSKDTPREFYNGKMETFLTCLALSGYLKNFLADEKSGEFFEESSLNAVHKTMFSSLSLADGELLFSEMPNILKMPYPVVNEIRKVCLTILPQVTNFFKMSWQWREFMEYDYLKRILESMNR